MKKEKFIFEIFIFHFVNSLKNYNYSSQNFTKMNFNGNYYFFLFIS